MNVGVLCSGNGSNLQALLDAERKGELAPAQIRAVIANLASAYALRRAEAHGVPAILIAHKSYQGRAEFELAVLAELQKHQVDLVVLAGFMRLLSPLFLRAFPDRVLNIHPALLPAFPGTHGVKQALEYGVRITGCTVHLVDEGCDTGPILLQEAVPVLDGDTEDSLGARIHEAEHRIYPQAVRLFARGEVTKMGRRLVRKQPSA